MPAADPLLTLKGALAGSGLVARAPALLGPSSWPPLAHEHPRFWQSAVHPQEMGAQGGPHTLPALTDLGVQVTGEC